jgi:serine protease Do
VLDERLVLQVAASLPGHDRPRWLTPSIAADIAFEVSEGAGIAAHLAAAREALDGALVAGTVKDAPAAKAGLKVGDVILAFDGKPVASSRALQRIVADTMPDREAEVVIVRDGKESRLRCHVDRLKEASAADTPTGEAEPATPSGDR